MDDYSWFDLVSSYICSAFVALAVLTLIAASFNHYDRFKIHRKRKRKKEEFAGVLNSVVNDFQSQLKFFERFQNINVLVRFLERTSEFDTQTLIVICEFVYMKPFDILSAISRNLESKVNPSGDFPFASGRPWNSIDSLQSTQFNCTKFNVT